MFSLKLMLKKIEDKIEKIRLEPEQVRIRWVWTCVLISMFFIVMLWLFSISVMFQSGKKTESQGALISPDVAQQFQNLKQQAPSLQDYTQQPLNIGSEGIGTNTQNDPQSISSIPQSTTDATDNQTPQTDAYSQLQNSTTGQ